MTLRKNLFENKRRWKGFEILTALTLFSSVEIAANPQNPTVVNGTVSFSHPNAQTLVVNASDTSIINWDGFSISAMEVTKFNQPNQAAVVLNRVTGGSPSAIMGKLESNGKLFLINPNGVLVGATGIVNTSSFIASTLDVMNSEFIAKGDLHFNGMSTAAITNLGSIDGWVGDVILIGYSVNNQGTLRAPRGIGGEAAGRAVLFSPTGSERITIIPSVPPAMPSGDGVQNSGTISSAQVELKADGNLFASAIKDTGTIDATGIAAFQGRVMLVAQGGSADVNGKISADNTDGTGGEIRVLGDTVHLGSLAVLDVSGDFGGGMALIGGNVPGFTPVVVNSHLTTVDNGARISAQANGQGDGGIIHIWSDGDNIYHGSAVASAGEISGNGGQINIAGVQNLLFTGDADTSSEYGQTGVLNLGSRNIFVQNHATPTMNAIPPMLISNLLWKNNMGITAFTFTNTPSTLTVGDALSWGSSTVLQLEAYGSLYVNADITYWGGDSTVFLRLNGHSNLLVESIAQPVTISLPASTLSMEGGMIAVLGGSSDMSSVKIETENCNIFANGDIILRGGAGHQASVELNSGMECTFDSHGNVHFEGGIGTGADVMVPQNAKIFVHGPTS